MTSLQFKQCHNVYQLCSLPVSMQELLSWWSGSRVQATVWVVPEPHVTHGLQVEHAWVKGWPAANKLCRKGPLYPDGWQGGHDSAVCNCGQEDQCYPGAHQKSVVSRSREVILKLCSALDLNWYLSSWQILLFSFLFPFLFSWKELTT